MTVRPTQSNQLEHLQRRLMIATLGLLLVACFLGGSGRLARAQEVPELKVNSKQYIVIDADTGQIFAQRRASGPENRAAMASLTKVITTVMAIEMAPPDYTITTAESDLQGPSASVMGFGPGETFTLEDLVYGMMLPSGNDAAFAVARSLGAQPGDDADTAVQRFIDRANQRLKDMGLTDTHLVRPDGWGVPNHYTTPHDLAVFTMYAMQFPRFVRAMSSQTYETSDGSYALVNNNRLMNSYDSLVGGKTGYDLDSGWCLIEVASRNGNTMISVTFDGIHPDDWYDDNRVLLEYALDQKERQQASGLPAGAQFVSFKDPDAAVIARSAQTGGSLAKVSVFEAADQPAASAPRLVPAGDFEAPAGDDRQLIGALGAVGVVMLAGLSRSLFGGRVRHAPAPTMTSTDRRRRLSRLTRSSALPTRPGSLDT